MIFLTKPSSPSFSLRFTASGFLVSLSLFLSPSSFSRCLFILLCQYHSLSTSVTVSLFSFVSLPPYFLAALSFYLCHLLSLSLSFPLSLSLCITESLSFHFCHLFSLFLRLTASMFSCCTLFISLSPFLPLPSLAVFVPCCISIRVSNCLTVSLIVLLSYLPGSLSSDVASIRLLSGCSAVSFSASCVCVCVHEFQHLSACTSVSARRSVFLFVCPCLCHRFVMALISQQLSYRRVNDISAPMQIHPACLFFSSSFCSSNTYSHPFTVV